MARMTPADARLYAEAFNIPLDRDFHALDSETVGRVLRAADEYLYRAPRNANGSRGRYFHAMLVRTVRREA